MKNKKNKPLLRSSRMKYIARGEANFGSIKNIITKNIELKDDKIRLQLIEYIFNKNFSDVNITDTDKKIILDFVNTTTTTLEGRELLGFLMELSIIVSDFIEDLKKIKKEIEELKNFQSNENLIPPEYDYLKQIDELINNFYLKIDINNIRIIGDNSQKLIDDLIRNKDDDYINFIYSVIADKIKLLLFANIVIQVSFNIQYLNIKL